MKSAGSTPEELTRFVALRELAREPGGSPRAREHRQRAWLAARAEVVKQNMGLVVVIASRIARRRKLDPDDLISFGSEGLLRALETYEADRYRLSTYAQWWIRHYIDRWTNDTVDMVRVPVHARERNSKLYQHRRRFVADHGRAPTDEELARVSGVDVVRVERDAAIVWSRPASLDVVIGDSGAKLGDVVEDEHAVSPERATATHEREVIARRLLATLTPREQEVVRRRFGFDGDDVTLKGIGDSFDLSRERIRQVETKALATLRKRAARFAGLQP
jgi:RNA polymerase primary sigma factor